jgi:hypothetical protein
MIGNRISCGIVIFAVALFFKETRGSVLLSRKAHALNQWYEELEAVGYTGVDILSETGEKVESRRIRWKVKSDEERESIAKMIGISCYRPFRKFDQSIKKGRKAALTHLRPTAHRTCRVLVLSLGLFLLGRSVSSVWFCSISIRDKPWIQPSADWISLHLYGISPSYLQTWTNA